MDHSIIEQQSAAKTMPAWKRGVTDPGFNARQRFLRVSRFFLGLVIHVYIWDIFLNRFALTRWYVRRSMIARWVTMARQFRAMALELGGMQIKLGQFLSSRADIVPEAVRRELAGLQDEVPAAPVSHVLEVIIAELGGAPGEIFQHFNTSAVAAASLGQVHYAILHDGREVAVKVQRPAIDRIIEVDLSAVSWVVRLIKNYPPIRRRADLEALVEEFARVLLLELDYVQEGRNAQKMRANFADTPGVYIPQIIPELTTRRVLVMERISGIKINDLEALHMAGINCRELAVRLNESYLKQFFIDGFFHADPHPGNLFVRLEPELPVPISNNGHLPDPGNLLNDVNNQSPPITGRPFALIIIDFGMTGQLTPQTMATVRAGVLGLAVNDAEKIVAALDQLNMILPGADRRPITQAIQTMLRFSFNRTMREMTNIDIEAIFDETSDIIYDMPFQIPQDLLYLGRAISMVAGLATEIDPDINLFQALRPFAQQMIERDRREADWGAEIQRQLTELGQIFLNLPRQMDAYYRAANRGELQTRSDVTRLERGLRRVERSTDRLAGGMFATGFFLGGVQLRTRGMTREANQAWWAAAAAVIWTLWPRNDR